MRKLAIALAISLLPIISISPAEAKVCTYKSRQYKDTSSQAYTKYVYKKSRVCR
jgi:hypothetical protein